MKQPLKNKVVWLTGASSGIGESLAQALSRQGAHLILSARRLEALEKVKAKCTGDVRLLRVDLAEAGSLEDVAKRAWRLHEGIDVVIHNAGIAHRDFAVKTSLEVDHQVMQVNYFGPVALTKALLPKMLERKAGRFVVVSSLSGVFGVPRLSAYAASKHALHGFFESLRAEVHREGVRISLVVPGFVRTSITLNALTGDGSKHGKMDAVMEEGMPPDECAAQIVQAIRSGAEESFVGGAEMIGVSLQRLTPGIWRKVMRNHPMKTMRKLAQTFGFKA
jgi:dehydrogenase/reductase SDR family member 7B